MILGAPSNVAESINARVQARVERANASRAQFLGLSFVLIYLAGGIGDAIAMGSLRNHGFMGLQCLASFAVVAIVRWVVPARMAGLVFAVLTPFNAGFGGAHVAQFGGFDGPWFYGCYTLPPVFIAMLLTLRVRVLATLGSLGAFTAAYWLRRPDLFDYPMAHVPLIYLATVAAVTAGIGHWVYRLEVASFRDLERVEDIASRLETRLQSPESGQLRAALARQLHDDVAQLITGARFQLDSWNRRTNPNDDSVDRLSSLLDELSSRAHTMLDQLRSPPERGPLLAELEVLRRDLAELGLTIDLLLDDSWVTTAPPPVANVVINVTREALINAVRHARASQATVSSQANDGEVSLLVLDNGGGRVANLKEGHGLRGIREQARGLGGRVEVSDYEAGLRLAVTWPQGGAA